jgi:transposase
MKERITLTLKELKRLKVIEMTLAKQLCCEEAAKKLGNSERHFYRILSRYKAGGGQGLAHASRGRPSSRRISAKTREQIRGLLEEEYADYNSLHLLEVLETEYHIKFS